MTEGSARNAEALRAVPNQSPQPLDLGVELLEGGVQLTAVVHRTVVGLNDISCDEAPTRYTEP